MKKISHTISQVAKQTIVVGILVLAGVALAAPVVNPTINDVKPLLNVGDQAQRLTGALVATGYNANLQQALLQLGTRGISYFEKGNGIDSDLLIRDHLLVAGDLILSSQPRLNYGWEKTYPSGGSTVQLSSIPKLVVDNGILSTPLKQTGASETEVCVKSDGTIIACVAPECKTYTGASTSQPASDNATGCLGNAQYADITDTDAFWKWTCSDGGVTMECVATRPAQNGSCKTYGQSSSQPATNTATGCNVGNYYDTNDDTSNWNWQCTGVNGGTTTNCSSPRTTANGQCVSYNGSYSTEPATDQSTGCISGLFNDTAESGSQWTWQCLGINGGTTANCTANVKVTNGSCKNYPSTYLSSPATNTSTGCTSGTYQTATPQDDKWTWQCLGSIGGTTANCEASKEVASCKTYTQYQNYSSQPATNTATGCTVGTYVDVADPTDQYIYHPDPTIDTYATGYSWDCRHGTTTGQNKTCTVLITKINGSCNSSYTGTYSSQPATNTATGCTSGYYIDVSDSSTDYKWRCVGRNSGTNANNCSAKKQVATPVDICTGNDCVYYCGGTSTSTTGNYQWQILQTNTPQYTNAPYPYTTADCKPSTTGNVSSNLSNGLSNCITNPDGLCSDSYINIGQNDVDRYFCGKADNSLPPGAAIEIWNSSGAPGSPAAFTGAKCES